ncbi:hypothetical protein GCM10027612_56770 [Microbispora bryophytorum subsp. camponoti]
MLPHEAIPAGPAVLRLPVEGDADEIARACADPEIARFIPFVPSPYTRDDALAWITKTVPATWENGGADFLIADAATDRVLGAAGLKPPDRFGATEVGYWLAPWARGRGVVTTAVRALAEPAFARGVPGSRCTPTWRTSRASRSPTGAASPMRACCAGPALPGAAHPATSPCSGG